MMANTKARQKKGVSFARACRSSDGAAGTGMQRWVGKGKGWSLCTAARGRDAKDHGCVSRAPRRRGFCQAVWRWQRAEKSGNGWTRKIRGNDMGCPPRVCFLARFFVCFPQRATTHLHLHLQQPGHAAQGEGT